MIGLVLRKDEIIEENSHSMNIMIKKKYEGGNSEEKMNKKKIK